MRLRSGSPPCLTSRMYVESLASPLTSPTRSCTAVASSSSVVPCVCGADRIEPGAFARVISEIKSGAKPWPALLYGHQMDSLAAVMGSIIDFEELAPGNSRLPQRLQQNGWGGLKATARFNLKTASGRDGFELASAGDLPSWSFAYVPGDFEFMGKGDNQVRSLRTIEELFECSLVVVPMNPEARTLTVAGMKSGISDLRIDRIQEAVLVRLAKVFRS